MAYVYYVPPSPLATVQEQPPSLCNPERSSFICGPLLIVVGGIGALMIGFFERRPAVIWPIISFGAVLCAIGVLLARRHVKIWRDAEQERQRAMWRTVRTPITDPLNPGGDGGAEFDVPLYCLEAPSLPFVRPSNGRTPGSSQHGFIAGAGGGGGGQQEYDSDYWCALAVPLKPDDVSGGEYLNWTAMTLVVQPHYKFGSSPAPAPANAASAGAGAATNAAGGGGNAAGNILSRTIGRATLGGYSRFEDGYDGGCGGEGRTEHASEPMLCLVRSPSVGTRSARASLHSERGSLDRRVGWANRPGRMGDLLSLFAVVAGNGGGGGDDAAFLQPEVDENGVELAGVKAMAAAAAAQRASSLPLPPPQQQHPLPSLLTSPSAAIALSLAPPLPASSPVNSRPASLQHQRCVSVGGAATAAGGNQAAQLPDSALVGNARPDSPMAARPLRGEAVGAATPSSETACFAPWSGAASAAPTNSP